eukprot:gene17101-18823_t
MNLPDPRDVHGHKLPYVIVSDEIFARWQIFRKPIKAKPKTVDGIVKACLCLHNDLRLTDNARYIPSGFLDSESTNGDIEFGDWRNMVSSNSAFKPISTGKTFNSSADAAKSTRRAFTDYFYSPEGEIPCKQCWKLTLSSSSYTL